MPMDNHRAANLANWNERVPVHVNSDLYDLAGLIAPRRRLSSAVQFDCREVGDVRGKSLLHLQCHIGKDTLSWAALGAHVTGIDFSAPAIDAARTLSKESGLPGRFFVAELYDSPIILREQFDVVYTGVGALCWLPDIRRWAQVVAGFLKPGGVFYIREGHPVLWALDDNIAGVDSLRLAFPYFETPQPIRFEQDGTYTDGDAHFQNRVTYQWNHGLGEIVNALIEAGLRIDSVREYPFCEWQAQPCMVRGEDGNWRLPDHQERLPLMYSIRATKTI